VPAVLGILKDRGEERAAAQDRIGAIVLDKGVKSLPAATL
jgi:hypothetical protein